MTTPRSLRNVLLAFCVVVASSHSLTAQLSTSQSPSAFDIVSARRIGTPQQIAETIESLDAQSLTHEEIVGQLVFLLNDDRPCPRSPP